jgi:hypothetical protein
MRMVASNFRLSVVSDCHKLIRLLISKGQVWEEAMFLRVVRAAGGKGVKHEYVRWSKLIGSTARRGIARFSISGGGICWHRTST